MNDTQIIIYQSEDGKTKIETRLENENLWLNIDQMSEVFQKARSTINEHILNIYKEKELEEQNSMRKIGISDFSTKPTNFYNLDMVIAVGYRVRSSQGTKFRQWATTVLKEYLVKGFTMNDELLKEAGGGKYFEELLARIRDIRSSEKVFYRKILDIYETSVDYNPNTEISEEFFKTVQNKMHFAAHGHTAAEIIFQRADADKQNMGLTTFKGEKPNKKEIQIAKNYLNEDELNILNRIVVAYLEFAELQALNRKPMYMKDWIVKLDDFLKMSGRELLESKGIRSHTQAINKAKDEYEKFKQKTKDELSRIEKDFVKYIDKTGKALKDKK
ncbi:virulence RhuM family protein [Aliarcobacter butzleri]|uniref:virulence RhuM family protein n=1 Tax=Aliarcobacter butzleri TaxID=28197 RepID=UPI003AF8F081